MIKVKYLIGQKKERLTLLERKGGIGVFKCECGEIKEIKVYNVFKGSTSSCGCLNIELSTKRIVGHNTKHGLSKISPVRSVYYSMKARCYRKTCKEYPNYGLRGISICEEWLNSLEKFHIWSLSNGYKKGLEIDRIDVNGNYEPSNCRWITKKEQNSNKRNTLYVDFKGGKIKFVDLLKLTNIKKATIYSRIYKYGLSAEEALSLNNYELRDLRNG